MVGNIHSVFFDAAIFENVLEPYSIPHGATHGSNRPLIPAGRRIKFGATVSSAFEGESEVDVFKFSF